MEYPDQNTLRDALRVTVRGLIPAMLVGFALAVGVYLLADRQPDSFAAEASLLVVNSNPSPGSFDVSLVTAPRIDATAYRAAILSGPVLDEALRFLGVADPTVAQQDQLATNIEIDVSEMDESSVVTIRARGSTAQEAASRANALTQAILAWDQRRASRTLSTVAQTLSAQISAIAEQIASLQESGAPQAQIDVLLAQRNDLAGQLNAARALMASAVGRLEVLNPAPVPSEPVPNRSGLLAAAALTLGAFFVYAVLIVRNAMDTRIRTMPSFANATGVPVIAEYERPPKSVHRIDGETASYLRAHVLYAVGNTRPSVVVVTSPHEDPDRPKVAMGLAVSIARSGLRTLLIDANLRSPSVGQHLNIRPGEVPDLAQYLNDDTIPLRPIEVSTNAETRLFVVPSSGSVMSPSELLDREFESRLNAWKGKFDVVVVEAPPVLEVADVLSIAPHATGVVLVADLTRLTRRDAKDTVDAFRRVGTPILGAAVRGAEDRRDVGRRSDSKGRRPASSTSLQTRSRTR